MDDASLKMFRVAAAALSMTGFAASRLLPNSHDPGACGPLSQPQVPT